MNSLRELSNQLLALRVPLLMALFATVLFTVPGQTVETYRALAQLLATSKLLRPEDYLALRIELGMGILGVVLVSLALWLTARGNAADFCRAQPKPVEETPTLLLWIPRLLALAVPIAVSIGIYNSRVPSNFVDNVQQKMIHVFKFQEIRDGLSERLAERLATKNVSTILSFDDHLLQFSGAMALVGLALFAVVTLIDRPALAKLLSKQKPSTSYSITTLVIALIGCSVAAFCYDPVQLPQYIGSLFIMGLFLSAMQLSLYQFQQIRKQLGAPVVWILVCLAVLFSLLDINDNHPIRSVDSKNPRPAEKTHLTEAFDLWMSTRLDKASFDGKPYPLFVVAAQGGGIYAAKHASSFLSEIQDLCPGFGHHLFAISGVSGGSVGASIFGALTRDFSLQKDWASKKFGCVDDPEGGRKALFEDATTSIFQKDLWSPLAAGLLFPDFLQRFLPSPIDTWDRALWLDYALEDAYRRGIIESGFLKDLNQSDRPLEKAYLDTWDPERYSHSPALILNATEVASGERLVVSPFSFPGVGLNFLPIWDAQDDTSKPRVIPPLSSGAGLSARFPWITPAAYFFRTETNSSGDPELKKIRIVDGGYFENSGVVTSLDLIKGIVASINDDTGIPIEINLLVFTSAGFDTPEAKSLGEIIDPIRTMFSTRQARAGIAIREALSELRNLSTSSSRINANVIRLELNGYEYPLPLGWRLSPVTRHLISFQNGNETTCEQDIDHVIKTGNKLDASCAKKMIFDRLK